MIAGIILACSVVFLLQFFSKQALSPEVRDVTGIATSATADDFPRVMQLLHLCPETPEDRSRVQAVGAYFDLLSLVRKTLAKLMPSLRSWTDVERGHCAYFAAVALERRIAFSRDMLAQQMDA
jgi:hypothetical protein